MLGREQNIEFAFCKLKYLANFARTKYWWRVLTFSLNFGLSEKLLKNSVFNRIIFKHTYNITYYSTCHRNITCKWEKNIFNF